MSAGAVESIGFPGDDRREVGQGIDGDVAEDAMPFTGIAPGRGLGFTDCAAIGQQDAARATGMESAAGRRRNGAGHGAFQTNAPLSGR